MADFTCHCDREDDNACSAEINDNCVNETDEVSDASTHWGGHEIARRSKVRIAAIPVRYELI